MCVRAKRSATSLWVVWPHGSHGTATCWLIHCSSRGPVLHCARPWTRLSGWTPSVLAAMRRWSSGACAQRSTAPTTPKYSNTCFSHLHRSAQRSAADCGFMHTVGWRPEHARVCSPIDCGGQRRRRRDGATGTTVNRTPRRHIWRAPSRRRICCRATTMLFTTSDRVFAFLNGVVREARAYWPSEPQKADNGVSAHQRQRPRHTKPSEAHRADRTTYLEIA